MKLLKGFILKSETTSGGGITSDSGKWEIILNTDKTLKLKMVKEPEMIWGESGLANDIQVGETVMVRKTNTGPHSYKELSDGTFVIYAHRNGVPHYFEPMKGEVR